MGCALEANTGGGADVTSLCDRCFAPGQCCRHLHLSMAGGRNLTTWVGDGESERQMADMGLPFVALDVLQGPWIHTAPGDPHDGREYVRHVWGCPKLDGAGRCTIYDDRPDLCRRFEPGSDRLCVHFGGAEAGDPTVSIDDPA